MSSGNKDTGASNVASVRLVLDCCYSGAFPAGRIDSKVVVGACAGAALRELDEADKEKGA